MLTHNDEYEYLSVILSPMNELRSDERYARAKLYETNDTVELELIYDKLHVYDSSRLEVYYEGVYIGYVQKKFITTKIDHTEKVDSFCFDSDEFLCLSIVWDGEKLMLKKKNIELIKTQTL